jgi:hypothetical protein
MKIIRRWLDRRAIDGEMREEMEFHIEERIASLIERGMAPNEAARTARIEFGSTEAHREEGRAAFGYRRWDELRSDFRFAARSLRKEPGYSVAAIAILAVAIGVNSAFFILFSHHVLKPLSIKAPERHFELQGFDQRARSTGGWTAGEIHGLTQASQREIEGFYTNRTIQMLVLEPVQHLSVISFVSHNYFQLLGGGVRIGRTFSNLGPGPSGCRAQPLRASPALP